MHRRSPLFATLFLIGAASIPSCADGQDPGEDTAAQVAAVDTPAATDWQVRADRGHDGETDFAVESATPGWRITTAGFSGILWHPDRTGTGTYEVIATIDVLPGSRRTEGYGILLGGSGLEGDDQRYTYVLLRNDGKYLVKTRAGDGTSTVVDWTASSAIRTLPESAADGDTAANTLVVQVTSNSITLLINGERVLRRPRGELPLDGIVGLRVNHGLELHVHALDVGVPAAPAE